MNLVKPLLYSALIEDADEVDHRVATIKSRAKRLWIEYVSTYQVAASKQEVAMAMRMAALPCGICSGAKGPTSPR